MFSSTTYISWITAPRTLLMLALGWLGLCLASTAILAISVPLLAADLDSASWRSYIRQFYPLQVAAVLILLGGIGYALKFKSVKTPAWCLASSLICLVASNEAVIFRIAIAAEWAKVGCFTYETKECRTMLGLSAVNAPSMYQNSDSKKATAHSSWYAVNNQLKPMFFAYRIPGIAFLTSPRWVLSSKEIREHIYRQRNELIVRQYTLKAPEYPAPVPQNNLTAAQSLLSQTLHASEKRIAEWRAHIKKQENVLHQTLWQARHPVSTNQDEIRSTTTLNLDCGENCVPPAAP